MSPQSKTVAVMQPYFLPYVGYWQLFTAADTFVLLDDAAFITRGWIHRNRILVNGEPHLFTVPLAGISQNVAIRAMERADVDVWPKKFLKTLSQNYGKAPYYAETMRALEPIILCREQNLLHFILHSFGAMKTLLGIATPHVLASELHDNFALKGQDRIVDICVREQAARYVNLPGGVELYDAAAFEKHGIALQFLAPLRTEYPQRAAEFVPWLSIIDILMHAGCDRTRSMLRDYSLS